MNTIIATKVTIKYVVENGTIGNPDSGTTNQRTVTYDSSYHTMDATTDIQAIIASMVPDSGYGDGEWTAPAPNAGDNVAGTVTYTYSYKVVAPSVSQLPLTGGDGISWQIWLIVALVGLAAIGAGTYFVLRPQQTR